jgi:Ice-binding-like
MRIFGTALALLSVGMFGVMLAPLASADSLNSADNFAVLAGSTVTNVDATIITGNMGVSPGSACTGFVAGTGCTLGAGIVNGTVDLGNAIALQAQKDLTTAYTTESLLPSTGAILGGNLTGMTLGPGVYTVGAATSNLTGTLTLTDHGVAGSIFVFQMSSTLITSPDSMINVAGLSPSDKVFWVVGSTATLGDNTAFDGNILALTDIIFDPGATDLCGRALARNGEVTFAGQDATSKIENQVASTDCTGNLAGSNGLNGITAAGTGGSGGGTSVPEPGTWELLLAGALSILSLSALRRHKHNSRSLDFC